MLLSYKTLRLEAQHESTRRRLRSRHHSFVALPPPLPPPLPAAPVTGQIINSDYRFGRPSLFPAGSHRLRRPSRPVQGAATPWLGGAGPNAIDAQETLPSQEWNQDDRASKHKLQGELVPFSSSLWIGVLAHVLYSVHLCDLFSELYLLCANSYTGTYCLLCKSGIYVCNSGIISFNAYCYVGTAMSGNVLQFSEK